MLAVRYRGPTAAVLSARPRVLPLATTMWRQLGTPDRLRLVAAGAAMALAAAGDAAVPVLIGDMVDQLVADPASIADLALVLQLMLVTGLLLGAQLLQVGRRQLVETVATAYERDHRTTALNHVLHLAGRYFLDRSNGAVYMRTTRGIEGSTKLLKLTFTDLLPTIALAVAAIAVALSRNALLGLLMIAVVPTSLALVQWQIRSQDGVRTRIRDTKEAIDGTVIEVLPAASTVRAYNAEPVFTDKVRSGAEALRSAEMAHHRAMGLFDSARYGNEALWFVAVLAVAILLVRAGTSGGPGEVLAAALLFQKVLTPVRELHRVLDESAESAKQAADLLQLLAEPRDPGYEARPALAAGSDDVLRLRSVSFEYPGSAGSAVLRELSLRIRPGERIALVGRSGCGKSTLLKLVDRLEHGYTGRIEVFGRDLLSYTHRDLADRVAYVAQDPFLFRGSVRENIVFGLGDVPETEIVRVARKAHVHDVVMALPEGYDTIVQERGASLSGGERQRICLARALLRSPDLLLLDEPTAALDNESQQAVRSAIDAIRDVTILEIAHRLDSIRMADRILVLDRGHVVQEGAFDTLARVPGQFRDLLAAQQTGTGEGDRAVDAG